MYQHGQANILQLFMLARAGVSYDLVRFCVVFWSADVHPIFVGDLSYDVESDTLRSAFEVFGKVT